MVWWKSANVIGWKVTQDNRFHLTLWCWVPDSRQAFHFRGIGLKELRISFKWNFHFGGSSLVDSHQLHEGCTWEYILWPQAKLASGSAVYNLSEIMTLARLRNIKLGVPGFCGCTYSKGRLLSFWICSYRGSHGSFSKMLRSSAWAMRACPQKQNTQNKKPGTICLTCKSSVIKS